MGPLSQCWVWARLPGHTMPSPGLASLRGLHPQLADAGALRVSRPLPDSLSSRPRRKGQGRRTHLVGKRGSSSRHSGLRERSPRAGSWGLTWGLDSPTRGSLDLRLRQALLVFPSLSFLLGEMALTRIPT